MCVTKLSVTKLSVTKLCVKELCVTKLCVCDKVVCGKDVREKLHVRETCAKELCVTKLCDKVACERDMCEKLCVTKLCVTKSYLKEMERHACHTKQRSMSPSATPATQSDGGCRQAPRLPRTVRHFPRLSSQFANFVASKSTFSYEFLMNLKMRYLKIDVSCEASVKFPHISQNAMPATTRFAKDATRHV